MDRLKSLEIFLRVADLRSFSRAAESLGISRASATRTVAELESEMRLRLFNRTTRSVMLTSDGERILEEARDILKRTDAVFAAAGSTELSGRLRVACTTSFAEFFLSEIVEDFGRRNPGLAIELLASDRILPLVESGIDVAFEVARDTRPGAQYRRLGACGSFLYASRSYLQANPAPQTPDDLRTHKLVGYIGETHWILAKGTTTRRVEVNSMLRFSAAGLVRDAVVRGCGISCLPDIAGEAARGMKELVPVLTDWTLPTRDIYAIFPALRFVHRGAAALAQEVETRIKTRNPDALC